MVISALFVHAHPMLRTNAFSFIIGRSRWSGVEKCGSDEQKRWRNLSHFFAKLTVAGMTNLSDYSALFMLLPHQQAFIAKGTPGWSGYLAGQALAAARW